MSREHTEEMERAIVARAHTICVPDPTKPPVFSGREPDSHRELFAPQTRDYGPGEEIELPVAEVRRLRGLGHLVDPAAKEVIVEDGQSYNGRLTLK
jgi:hypothetical protein